MIGILYIAFTIFLGKALNQTLDYANSTTDAGATSLLDQTPH